MKRDVDLDGQSRRAGPIQPPEPAGPQWMFAGIAVVVGLLVGFALGSILTRDVGPFAEDNGEAAVPPECREAIEAARTELAARERALSAPADLTDVLDRAGRAITSIDTAELELVLSDLEALADDARAAADELESNEFETHAQACEDASPGT